MMILVERNQHAIGFPTIFRSAKPEKRESKLLSCESPIMKYFPGGTVMESNIRAARAGSHFHITSWRTHVSSRISDGFSSTLLPTMR